MSRPPRNTKLLNSCSLPFIGEPIAVYSFGDFFCVLSQMNLGYWPSRTIPGVNRVLNQLFLYRDADRSLIRNLSGVRYTVNDIVAHPTEPLLAIACGDYDGGYFFDGELLLWNWRTGELRSLLSQSVLVSSLRFSSDTKHIEFLSSAPNEGDLEKDIFDEAYYHQIPLSGQQEELLFNTLTSSDMLGSRCVDSKKAKDLLQNYWPNAEAGLPIWDIKWVSKNQYCLVGEEVILEIRDLQGNCLEKHSDENGFGSEVLAYNGDIYVNKVYTYDSTKKRKSALLKFNTGRGNALIYEFDHDVSLSINSKGEMLVRNTGFSGRSQADAYIFREDHMIESVSLGPYDSMNHYLRIHGDENLFVLIESSDHNQSIFCSLETARLQVKELWELNWDIKHIEHLVGCIACTTEEVVVYSVGIHEPKGEPYQGFLVVREKRTGKFKGSFPTKSPATALTYLKGLSLVFYALADGTLGSIDLSSEIPKREEYPNEFFQRESYLSFPFVITAADWNGEHLIAATLDGKVLLFSGFEAKEP